MLSFGSKKLEQRLKRLRSVELRIEKMKQRVKNEAEGQEKPAQKEANCIVQLLYLIVCLF